MTAAGNQIEVRPVTPERWGDLAALFEARGGPGYCWCMLYRKASNARMANSEKREAMQTLVEGATPVGVLAYDGDEPVGWCSVAPRETYLRLDRSRVMPKVSDEPMWTVLCFFVRRSSRGAGLSRVLLQGAVDYARASGARFVEGYPWDTAGITSRFRGHSSVFRALGFEQDGARWWIDCSSPNA
jgi:GNAT superfamily N-acetyltransferase